MVGFMSREEITPMLREGIPTVLWIELRKRKGIITLIVLYYRPPSSQHKLEGKVCIGCR